MHSVVSALLLAMLSSIASFSDEGGWVDREGNRVPNSDAMKSVGGFGGWLVVTPDLDWEDKWNTPRETVPYFSEATEVRLGETLTILPFFINPLPDQDGIVSIGCDLKVIRPDDSVALDEKGLDCFTTKLQSDPRSVYLSAIYPKYVGETGDPFGTWIVEVVLRDNNRGVETPLKVKFELVDE